MQLKVHGKNLPDFSSTFEITSDVMQTVLDLFSQGASEIQVAASLGISKGVLKKAQKENFEFARCIELGNTLFEAAMEELGHKFMNGLLDKNANATVWAKFMAEKFCWRDKVELSPSTGTVSSMTDKELKDKLKELEHKV